MLAWPQKLGNIELTIMGMEMKIITKVTKVLFDAC